MIRVGITTYNRNEMCAGLVDALAGEGVNIHVYDDGSDRPFTHEKATVHRYDENGTITWWYLRVCALFHDASLDESWDYMLWLPDDIMPVTADVLGKLQRTFERLKAKDPEAVCINPFTLRHHPMMSWTGFEPVSRHGLWHTQWMDCCGFFDRRFATLALAAVRQCNPRWHWIGDKKGTGVGKAISITVNSVGYNIYQTKKTLFSHGDHPSVMSPWSEKGWAVTP